MLRTNDREDRGRVALRQPLHLFRPQTPRIDGDATLRPTEREIGHRALERHEHRKALDLFERDRWMEADPTFARSAAGRVLHAVTGEDLESAVVHGHRQGDDQRALRLLQKSMHPGVEIE